MAILTRDQILNADDLKQEAVQVDEWGGDVIVRCLTGTERDEWEASMTKGKSKDEDLNLENLRSRLLCLTIIDDKGARLFKQDKDVKLLGRKNAAVINRLFDVARRLSGIGQDDVEEMVKN